MNDILYFDWALNHITELFESGSNNTLMFSMAVRPFVYLSMSFVVIGVFALVKSMLFGKRYI